MINHPNKVKKADLLGKINPCQKTSLAVKPA